MDISWKDTVSAQFRANRLNNAETALPQNLLTTKLGELTVFFAVWLPAHIRMLIFSVFGVIERDQWHKVGWSLLKTGSNKNRQQTLHEKIKRFYRLRHCMKKKIWQKFLKKTENIIFSLVFVCLCFTEISYFLNIPSNENGRKQHLSPNAYFCVNMKLLYTIAGRKNEIFCRIVTKTSDFSLSFRTTFRWRYLSEKMTFTVALQRKQAIGQLSVQDVYFSQ